MTERIEPGPDQESVWDYPRPPAVSPCTEHVRIVQNGQTIASTRQAIRVLETSQAPAFYIPRSDIAKDILAISRQRSLCEWKGLATYWHIHLGNVTITDAGWSYEKPVPEYAAIAGHIAFYAQRLDECWVGEDQVNPNAGSFYGGWITSKISGPFKGAAGSLGW